MDEVGFHRQGAITPPTIKEAGGGDAYAQRRDRGKAISPALFPKLNLTDLFTSLYIIIDYNTAKISIFLIVFFTKNLFHQGWV